MDTSARHKLTAGAAAVLVIAGGGVAVGAKAFSSPKRESQAVIADAAKQLGIEPAKLSAALKGALKHRVDAAVESGRLTKAQGDALKARIDSGKMPLFPGAGRHPHGYGFGHHALKLDAAAAYLGLTEEQLRTELESGKTLAQIATAHGKTAAGLVDALVAAAHKKVDEAVAAGRLTRAEANSLLAGLERRITAFVNGRFPQPIRHHLGMRGFRGGPPGMFGPPRRHA
jgi:polyhydroxyalkanoate synthesis regulator phasin